MTVKEIMEVLEKQPEIVDLLVAYIEAKETNPQGTTMALPIILKILTDGKKQPEGSGRQGKIYGTSGRQRNQREEAAGNGGTAPEGRSRKR